MFRFFGRLRRTMSTGTSQGHRQRLSFDKAPAAIYAIGDIHGCLDLLLQLERLIQQDAESLEGEKWIVLLGDYIDRGPESAAVLDHLLQGRLPGFKRFCLAGNHEELMLSYLTSPSPSHRWLELGGTETLHSYGISQRAAKRTSTKRLLPGFIPEDHIRFLESAPVLLSVPGFVFVHAGIRPSVSFDRQRERDLLWIRPEDMNSTDMAALQFVVVHGHTPVVDVTVSPGRINIDTGAYISGVLSCIRIVPHEGYKIISAGISAAPNGANSQSVFGRSGRAEGAN